MTISRITSTFVDGLPNGVGGFIRTLRRVDLFNKVDGILGAGSSFFDYTSSIRGNYNGVLSIFENNIRVGETYQNFELAKSAAEETATYLESLFGRPTGFREKVSIAYDFVNCSGALTTKQPATYDMILVRPNADNKYRYATVEWQPNIKALVTRSSVWPGGVLTQVGYALSFLGVDDATLLPILQVNFPGIQSVYQRAIVSLVSIGVGFTPDGCTPISGGPGVYPIFDSAVGISLNPNAIVDTIMTDYTWVIIEDKEPVLTLDGGTTVLPNIRNEVDGVIIPPAPATLLENNGNLVERSESGAFLNPQALIRWSSLNVRNSGTFTTNTLNENFEKIKWLLYNLADNGTKEHLELQLDLNGHELLNLKAPSYVITGSGDGLDEGIHYP